MLLLLLTYKNPCCHWPTRVCCHTLTKPDYLVPLQNSTLGKWCQPSLLSLWELVENTLVFWHFLSISSSDLCCEKNFLLLVAQKRLEFYDSLASPWRNKLKSYVCLSSRSFISSRKRQKYHCHLSADKGQKKVIQMFSWVEKVINALNKKEGCWLVFACGLHSQM